MVVLSALPLLILPLSPRLRLFARNWKLFGTVLIGSRRNALRPLAEHLQAYWDGNFSVLGPMQIVLTSILIMGQACSHEMGCSGRRNIAKVELLNSYKFLILRNSFKWHVTANMALCLFPFISCLFISHYSSYCSVYLYDKVALV